MIFTDPETRQRVLAQDSCSDIQYLADQSSSAITNESIPVIGPWTDYTGSGGQTSRTQQMWGASENKNMGNSIQPKDKSQNNLGNVGERTGTTRRRRRLIYRELAKKNK